MLDALIVGGGPAGLAVAIGAARAGLDVAVCERRGGPVDKACGEGLMPSALSALHALGVDPPGHPIRGITYRQGPRQARARFRRGDGRGVRRTVLHDCLRAGLPTNSVRWLDREITEIVPFADHVEAGGVAARYLVAADGLHSPIRRRLGLGETSSRPPRWGLRQHFAIAPWTDFVEVTWAEHAEAYVTPVAADCVGVAILSSRRQPFPEQLRAFPELAERLREVPAVSRVRGAGPLHQPVRSRVSGRALLAGDAAGYIDALTGEGLAVSLLTGAALVQALVDDEPLRYERDWRSISRPSRTITSSLLWSRRHPVLGRRIVPLAAMAPPLFRMAVNQLAGPASN